MPIRSMTTCAANWLSNKQDLPATEANSLQRLSRAASLTLNGIDCKSLDTSQHTSHTCPPCLHTKRQHLRILKLAELVKAQELGELAKALYHNERKWRGIAYKFSP